jgi:hypothetical protein
MKKLQNRFLIALVLLISNSVLAQAPTPPDVGNYSCASAFCIEEFYEHSFDFTSNSGENSLYYSLNYLTPSNSFCGKYKFYMTCHTTFTIYGPFSSTNLLGACESITNYLVSPIASGDFTEIVPEQLYQMQISQQISNAGFYIIRLTVPNGCAQTGTIYSSDSETTNQQIEGCFACSMPTIPCEDCVTSFMPSKGKYMVSAWVKEVHTGNQPVSYENSELVISFTGSSVTYNLAPSGQIIDGWQRIEAEIEIPVDATEIHIDFRAFGTNEVPSVPCFFDDIRFFPYDGSMMSYVYDPRTLRLMAQLDERNYATLYEYDEEGKLIRVKKETERGIMTIQENRDNIVKKP